MTDNADREAAKVIGVVSAGAMGSAFGRLWAQGGSRVVTTLAGRNPRTAELATRASLELLPDLDAVVAAADVVVSIVPPSAAAGVASDVAASARRTGAHPLVADLNAVSPGTVSSIERTLHDAGLDLVDGSISGPPPSRPGTRLYLSGVRAAELADLPQSGLTIRILGDEVGVASALKMCTASVYKGITALMVQALGTASRFGVTDQVTEDLADSFPELVSDLPRWLAVAASKAERYVGEMREIAATQGSAGYPSELFEAMAIVWAHVAETKLAEAAPEEAARIDLSLEEVLDALAER
jgi:3-hydroxyisobutyrate dehydrogenase-like beta-hydroxyacid dehydrogenase